MTDLPNTRLSHMPRHQVQLVVVGVALAGVAVLVALLLLLLRSDHKSAALPAPNAGPALVSQAQLEQLADASTHAVYWAGPKEGYSYELTRTSDGRTYIRYLPKGAKAGDPRPDFLVVGTYAQPNSFAYLMHAAKSKDAVPFSIANDGLALFSAARPTSVYFTYPGARYQVEVFDPSGNAARRLVLAGKITPLK
jgi:hypothetical protein